MTHDQLLDTLQALEEGELEFLIARLEVSPGVLPGRREAPAQRALDLYRYAKSHGLLDRFIDLLHRGALLKSSTGDLLPPQLGHLRLRGHAEAVDDEGARTQHGEPAILPAAVLARGRLSRTPQVGDKASALNAASALRAGSKQDLCMSFDLSNPNRTELRITSLAVRVLQYNDKRFSTIRAQLGTGIYRLYSCPLQRELSLYECRRLDESYDYIKLTPNEMEVFYIAIQPAALGEYVVALEVEYSVGGSDGKFPSSPLRLACVSLSSGLSR